jgi:hypothetical protein
MDRSVEMLRNDQKLRTATAQRWGRIESLSSKETVLFAVARVTQCWVHVSNFPFV